MMNKSLKGTHVIQNIISFSNKNKKAIISKSYIIHFHKNNLGYSRFCYAVSKKNRSAPEKNYIKRQLREMTRDVKNLSYDFIIIPRTRYNNKDFEQNKVELIKTLFKVEKGATNG